MAVVTLGIGIALGGVWAYKVLGWGGYWGWDPVENASLVPWLVAVALLHGLFIQKTTGGLARANAVMALLGWLTVLGGTYLTRSGVLQDFSVHSFTDSGLHTPLVLNLALTAALSIGLLGWRWRSVESSPARWTGMSRETALWIGLVTVLVFAGLVAFGTTMPLLTALAGRPASVRPGFYQSVSAPLGGLVVVVMALAPALRWSRQAGLDWLKALVPGVVCALAALGVAAFPGQVRGASALALVGVSGFALGVNLWTMLRLFRRGWSYGSGYLGHAGLALMVLGMVLSATLGRSERVALRPGESRTALGYTLTWRGESHGARGVRRLDVLIERGDWHLAAGPELIRMPGGEGAMHKPAIDSGREIYLSPLEVRDAEGGEAAVAVLEFSTKPLVNLVWIGALVTLLGSAMAGVRRAIEAANLRRRSGVPAA
jgi:cytochrome c-type biogenesis protein CcmF